MSEVVACCRCSIALPGLYSKLFRRGLAIGKAGKRGMK